MTAETIPGLLVIERDMTSAEFKERCDERRDSTERQYLTGWLSPKEYLAAMNAIDADEKVPSTFLPEPEPTIAHTMLALKLTAILDRTKRIAGESITSGAAAVHAAYTGAIRTEFEHLLEDIAEGEL